MRFDGTQCGGAFVAGPLLRTSLGKFAAFPQIS